MKDKIVEQVINKYSKRSKVGIQKYGTTLSDNNTDDFLNHLQEELMDASLYIEKLMSRNQDNDVFVFINKFYNWISNTMNKHKTSSQLDFFTLLYIKQIFMEYLRDYELENILE